MSNSKFDDLEKKLEKKIASLSTDFNDIKNDLSAMNNYLLSGKGELEKIKKLAVKYESVSSDIVKLNVGGTYFSTLKTTLEKRIKKNGDEFHDPHLLRSIVSGIIKVNYDENKAIFIDRNPKYFGYILDYLRNIDSSNPFNVPKLNQEGTQELEDEANYFGLHGLIELINPFESLIIQEHEKSDFFNLCNLCFGKKWKRLYRASVDGFLSQNFHTKCDGIPNTLTIIKSIQGYVFGGYTTASWDQSSTYKNDKNSFIFSFINPSKKPSKMTCTNFPNSIYCHTSYGPTFGGHDIYIATNSNVNTTSYSNLGHSYALNGYTNGTAPAQSFLAGAYNFQVSEIEVFQRLP